MYRIQLAITLSDGQGLLVEIVKVRSYHVRGVPCGLRDVHHMRLQLSPGTRGASLRQNKRNNKNT